MPAHRRKATTPNIHYYRPNPNVTADKKYLFLLVLLLLLSLILISFKLTSNVEIKGRPNLLSLKRHYKNITQDDLVKIASSSQLDSIMNDLNKILVERVPDTDSHREVQNFLISRFSSSSWQIESDSFESPTPYGVKKFTNIIATHESVQRFAGKRVVLAAHYDSKYLENVRFLAATDSAVPCALLLDIANNIDQIITKDSNIGVQIVFFDGEEAFKDWTATDSLYGSRHLAEKWEQNGELKEIERFILLDLLGSPQPVFNSLSDESTWLFDKVAIIEQKLNKSSFLTSEGHPYFQSSIYGAVRRTFFGGIEDDHVPFSKRGVPCLHVIPVPFPKVWHTESDNSDNLDFKVIDDLSKIFKVFVAEYTQQ